MTYEDLLRSIALSDERYIVMTAENRGPMRGLPPALGNRFVDVGIAEQALIGAACGMALRGRIPVVHCLACFLTMRAFEFIRTDIGISGLPVKLIGTVAGLLSEANGPTHQAVEDIALMRGVPPMSILCPADIQDMLMMLPEALRSDGPLYLRYNPLPARTEHQPFVLGKAEQLYEGDDVAVITYGTLFSEAYDAVRLLREEGLAVRLINCRSLKPLDESVILPALTECRLIVTVEDHFRTGGLFAILSELCLQQRIAPDVRSISLGNRWFAPLMMDQLLGREGLDAVSLAARVRTWLDA